MDVSNEKYIQKKKKCLHVLKLAIKYIFMKILETTKFQ